MLDQGLDVLLGYYRVALREAVEHAIVAHVFVIHRTNRGMKHLTLGLVVRDDSYGVQGQVDAFGDLVTRDRLLHGTRMQVDPHVIARDPPLEVPVVGAVLDKRGFHERVVPSEPVVATDEREFLLEDFGAAGHYVRVKPGRDLV